MEYSRATIPVGYTRCPVSWRPACLEGAGKLALDPKLPKVMIEVPVLQDIPITWPHPPETGIDDQVSQDRATNTAWRRTFDFPFAQSHAQATCQVWKQLNGLHPTPSPRMLWSELGESVEDGPSPIRIMKRTGNHSVA